MIKTQLKIKLFWLLLIIAFNYFGINAEPVVCWIVVVLSIFATIGLVFWFKEAICTMNTPTLPIYLTTMYVPFILSLVYIFCVDQLGWHQLAVLNLGINLTVHMLVILSFLLGRDK